MDPLPLVTANFSKADVAYSIRRAFQETLDGNTYDIEKAKNIIRNDVDPDLSIKKTAIEILKISNDFEETIRKIDDAGKNIIDQQIQYITGKEKIDQCFELKEHLKLKRCNLLRMLETEFVREFGLIEANDLLPDIIHQYLDFRYYSISGVCAICSKEQKDMKKKEQKKQILTCVSSKLTKTEIIAKKEAFRVIPDFLNFHNYCPGQLYKKTMKIVNTSSITQSISLRKLPKHSIFFVHVDANSRIAPGMAVTASVIFQPKVYKNLKDNVIFKNTSGFTVDIALTASRDLPNLISCLFKSTCELFDASIPGNKIFSDTRREALNSSLDCGSCLVGQYILMSVLLQNKGIAATFFIITEDDWFSQDVESVSTCMEMNKNGFWIHPTFFEIVTDEIIELSIIFEPNRSGLHLENLYMICDNNSFEELQIIGDALEFSNTMIEISMSDNGKDISKMKDYCIHLGNVENGTSQKLILTVKNKSALCFNCKWNFQFIPLNGVHELKEKWISSEPPYQKYLVPYSTCLIELDISLDTQESGYHSTHLRFFVSNIPLACLDENEEFLIAERDTIDKNTLTEAVDVQITDFEIVCVSPKMISQEDKCVCETCKIPKERNPRLNFSEPFLNVGILPIGPNIRKNFNVVNLVDQKIDWSIAEIRYNMDSIPHIEVMEGNNLSCSSGTFHWRGQEQEIFYNIITEKPMGCVTVLVLLATNEENEPEIESICIVTYEIIEYDIFINTGHSTGPILCPLELLYVDVPFPLEFKIENLSPIAAGFYFLKPYGKDSDKISIKFEPQSSILKPFETRTVVAKILCSEVGLHDNLTVPCSVGLGRKPVEIRVLCGVDSLHVCFYLQGEAGNYKHVVWPPRIVYDFDNDWSICRCTGEECLEFGENSFHLPGNASSIFPSQDSKSEILKNNSLVSVDTENAAILESDELKCEPKSLEEILREHFEDEPFMLEEIVEIRNIPVNTATKTAVYFKNITPANATFTIDVQNFYGNKNSDPMIAKCISKNEVSNWNNLIGTEFGIVVQPEIEKGCLAPHGVVEINLWIFANTYGIYSEEITIDIPDIPPFSFTLLMEIIGSPIVFPMILNSLIEHPIVRIGCIPYNNPQINRQIKIRNISSIPLHIVWQTFVKLSKSKVGNEPDFSVAFDIVDKEYNCDQGRIVIFDKYLGNNTNQLCGVEPHYLDIKEQSDGIVHIFLDPKRFKIKTKQTQVKYHIMGHIYLQEIHRSKLNYFYRRTDSNINPIKIEVSAILELPTLTLDIICAETKLTIYANDVIFKKEFHHHVRLVLRNDSLSTCEAVLKVEEPFFVRSSANQKNSQDSHEERIVVKGLECEEVTITCFLNYQDILNLSELVYEVMPVTGYFSIPKASMEQPRTPRGKAIYCLDEENKVLYIKKNLRILHLAKLEKIIPIEMFIYFPNLKVKPSSVNFGSVLLNTTSKRMISVYNMTGCAVKFEIYKSTNATGFYVTPHYAEIPKSTGTNKEFVDIFIYFTPHECMIYQGAMRIVTNIPNYFIEVHMKANGTVNEKFYVNYKI